MRKALLGAATSALALASVIAVQWVQPRALAQQKSEPALKLKVGDTAPDFTLPLLDHSGQVTLSSFRGTKPVVLVFGSYT